MSLAKYHYPQSVTPHPLAYMLLFGVLWSNCYATPVPVN